MGLKKYSGVLNPAGKVNPFIVRDKKTGKFVSVKNIERSV